MSDRLSYEPGTCPQCGSERIQKIDEQPAVYCIDCLHVEGEIR